MKKCTLFMLAVALISLQQASAQSWNLTGNSNATTSSKLGTTNSIPLRFFTNNVERARITELGRVGIGITNPINILTVKASGGVPSSSWTNVSTQIFYGFAEAANGEFNIGTATNTATQRSLIQGKRARGTVASPAAVQADDYLASIVGSGYDGSAFQNPCEVDFYADGAPSSGHVPGRISFVTGTSISDRLERLKIGSTGDITVNKNQLFVQQSTGNVGIGTTSPTYKLYVNAGSTSGIYANTSSSYGVVGVSSNSSGYGLYGSGGLLGVYANGNTYGVYANGGTYGTYSYGSTNGVYGYSSTSTTTSIGVNGSGYTGVKGTGTYGTYGVGTSYGAYGDGGSSYGVYGTSTFLGVYGYAPSGSYGTYGTSSYIGAFGSGTDYGVYGYSSAKTGVYGYTGGGAGSSTDNGVYGYCNSTGVGVRGYSENGSGIAGSSGNYYAGYFTGNVYSTGSYVGSDRKLKSNIADVESGMDIINKLKPRIYEFRHDGNYNLMHLPQGKHYGLIAQELEQVLPNLVKETKFDVVEAGQIAPGVQDATKKPSTPDVKKSEVIDFKAVNYTELIPVMIKGMQEQDKVIKEKDAKIEELELQFEKLQNLLISKGVVSPTELSNTLGGSSISKARLDQNTPNPADGSTTLRYFLPATTVNASMQITSVTGAVLKSYSISQKGAGQLTINSLDFPAGTYFYTLYVDGKMTDSKKMVLNR